MNQSTSTGNDFTSSDNSLPNTTHGTLIHQDRDNNIVIGNERDNAGMERTSRADSDPPPSYSVTTDYRLCPGEGSGNESLRSSNSRLISSHHSDVRPFASHASEHRNFESSANRPSLSSSADANKPRDTKYQTPPYASAPDLLYSKSTSYQAANRNPCEVFKSKAKGYQTCASVSSEPYTRTPTSRLAAPTMASTSSVTTTTSATSARKTKEEIQKLISSSPELRDNIYILLATTVASVEAQQPSDIRAKDAKIEQLQVQLLEALNYGNEKGRRVEELEASLKVATDTGLSQIETLEEIHSKLKSQQETEKNLRRGNMSLSKQMDPLKAENAKLKRQLKDAEKEIGILKEKYDYQGQTLELLTQKARQTERINMRIEDDLTKLERENKLLVLKGEQMSGKLLAVAEQWHGPGLGSRKRQAEEVLDDGERERRFERMTR
ncbi:hypothetical protein NA56DRAFT_731902 [Hyaloscypha hepaticicola]|uniref:Uncharacterized protein n=1 Tax=Hyaloscypha hepaticicola TaxID=2082293 RepID=A0A2J6PPH3_9HELO|nr:hypothetical protein NA56DRAFT_731902 [Hyaloscypha hepaticicola]